MAVLPVMTKMIVIARATAIELTRATTAMTTTPTASTMRTATAVPQLKVRGPLK